jgi:hypothetical protein
MTSSGIEQYIISNGDDQSTAVVQAFVDTLKDRIDKVKEKDDELKVYVAKDKKKKLSRTKNVDSDLKDFL